MKRFLDKSQGPIVILTLVVVAAGFFVMDLMKKSDLNTEGSASEVAAKTEVDEEKQEDEPVEEPKPEPVDFQGVVDEWVASVGGNKSVVIYDLDREEISAEYNTGEDYIMESLYKLFVVYEGYKRVENGSWDKSTIVNSAGKTLEYCLYSAIRNSDSSCAEPLWGMIGRDELEAIAHDEWGISEKTIILRLISNVNDILTIMKRFYEHPDFSDEELVAQMEDSFLNQSPSAGLCNGPCDWRQGLPSGFSDNVKVYNKVGWRWGTNTWETYHDAAILEFPDGRHFIVVVMTNHISHKDIARLGTAIENGR